ncbi:hypothetical protein DFH08DRAFT_816941 [Mycena albidolilacea]|uniref:Uncharacterized protein n=1 Tax=Mycena albidolilacea TaxID=1033008 RepID=A0AAD7EHK5_9AGAR|nr:hypothetical protein DFH08DRAFT_816941 [Mycena albidolilacea]
MSFKNLGEDRPALRDVVVRIMSGYSYSALQHGIRYFETVFYQLHERGMLTVAHRVRRMNEICVDDDELAIAPVQLVASENTVEASQGSIVPTLKVGDSSTIKLRQRFQNVPSSLVQQRLLDTNPHFPEHQHSRQWKGRRHRAENMADTARLTAPNVQEEVLDTCQDTRYDMARGLEHPSDHAGTIAFVPQVVEIVSEEISSSRKCGVFGLAWNHPIWRVDRADANPGYASELGEYGGICFREPMK